MKLVMAAVWFEQRARLCSCKKYIMSEVERLKVTPTGMCDTLS